MQDVEVTYAEEEGIIVPSGELPDSEELFAGYVDKMFYGGYSFFGTSAGDRLSSNGSRDMYQALKEEIFKVASGQLSSTVFSPDAVLTYTNMTVDAAKAAFVEDIAIIMDALLHDCPYELYWYDKTTGIRYSYLPKTGTAADGSSYVNISLSSISFYVTGSFQLNSSDLAVNTAKTGAASTATANARAIVDEYASLGDYEKLVAYKDKICAMVSYDHAALSGGSYVTDNSPWQLIHVFDGDTGTGVVCEGYSKAFQYLCDNSTFTAAECYTVTGQMVGGTGAGGHMWNIVTMEDGKNYLADVTNSDAGSVGQYGGLFLAGGTAASREFTKQYSNGTTEKVTYNGYNFIANGSTIFFGYEEDMEVLWGTGSDSILNIAASDYVYQAPCNHTAVGGTAATCTDKAVCGNCGKSFGTVDKDNHANTTEFDYRINTTDATKHDKIYKCCGDVAAVEAHNYVGGACEQCGTGEVISSVSVSVTAPEAGAVPQSSVAEGTGYTAAISWSGVADKFGYNTAYTVTVTLTATGSYRFAATTQCAGYQVSASADGKTLTLTKTFDATRKEKLTNVTALTPVVLDVYCATIADALAKLPMAVSYITETGTVQAQISWSNSTGYDATPGAVNTFTWVVSDAQLSQNYEQNGVATTGTLQVTNAAAVAVNNSGLNKQITYAGNTFDVSSLFSIDENAGAASYALLTGVSSAEGEGTLTGSMLAITKAGIFTVELTTAAQGAYGAGTAQAVLTVAKGAGSGALTVEDWTYGENGNIAVSSATNTGNYSVLYTGTDNAGTGYSSASEPENAGSYTVKVVFPTNGLYEELTLTDAFDIKKAIPELGVVSASGTLYESTLVSEVVLTASNSSVSGSLELDGVTELTVGTAAYSYKFVPDDTNNYEVVTGKVNLTVQANALQQLDIISMPTKLSYTFGEFFELTGAQVLATYADGTVKDVTAYVTCDTAVVAGQTEVVLYYQGKTCTVNGITVAKYQLNVSNLTWTASSFEYDGEKKEIYLAGDLPGDVVIAYSGNEATDAGQYTASAVIGFADEASSANYEIIGGDAYQNFSWSISPKEVNEANVTYELGASLIYNGTEQTQDVKFVKCDGLDVTYDVHYNTGEAAGDYVLNVNANGNFTGNIAIPFSIARKDITGAQVVIGGDLTYSGTEQTQEVKSVTVDGITLTADDYSIVGNTGTDASSYTIVITGKKNFSGGVNKIWNISKVDISQAELSLGADKIYNGVAQTIDVTLGEVNGLTATVDVTGETATNAGEYEVTVTGKGNFTGTVKKTWRIAQKSIESAQVVLGSALTFNGAEQSQSVSSVTVDGMTLSSTDYTLSGDKAVNVGAYTLTVSGRGDFTGTVTCAFTIVKAQAPVIAQVDKRYVSGAGAAESIDLARLLPQNTGAVTYQLTTGNAAYVTDAAVSASGILTYKVGTNGAVGDSTVLTVTVETQNYEDIVVKVAIAITDKFVTVQKVGAEVALEDPSGAIYGKKLSDLALNSGTAVFVVEGTSTVVSGTLAWVVPDMQLRTGSNVVQWKFTPQDGANYAEATGTLTVQVAKATPVVSVPAAGVITYNPAVSLADITLVGTKGSHVVGGVSTEVDGDWSWKSAEVVPSVNNPGYVAVFTPVDTVNYNTVEVNVAVEVAKAVPYVEIKPSAGTIVYGDSLEAAELTGGKVVYKEGSSYVVAGSFDWVNRDIVPSVADSGTTLYEVMFTPSDTDNYSTLRTSVTVAVDKAQNAPNMPVAEMTVAYSKAKVQDVELPEGWSWQAQDAEKDLTVGEAVEAVAEYVGADVDNYRVITVVVAITREQQVASNVPQGPTIAGDDGEEGWNVIREEIAHTINSEAMIVNMNGETTVPANIFGAARGRDVTLVFRMGNGLSWTIDGQSIAAVQPHDISFAVEAGTDNIPRNVLERVAAGREHVNVSLGYSGEFGLTAILNINVRAENAGRYANLFYYNEEYGYMQFMGADEINEQGIAHLAFTHASEYSIVIADTILDSVHTSPKTGDTSPLMAVMAVAFVMLAGCVVSRRKRYKEM